MQGPMSNHNTFCSAIKFINEPERHKWFRVNFTIYSFPESFYTHSCGVNCIITPSVTLSRLRWDGTKSARSTYAESVVRYLLFVCGLGYWTAQSGVTTGVSVVFFCFGNRTKQIILRPLWNPPVYSSSDFCNAVDVDYWVIIEITGNNRIKIFLFKLWAGRLPSSL